MIERGGDARGDLVFSRWEKHRHKAAHNERVKLEFSFGEARGRLQRWDDREVVAHLGVVENPLGGLDVAVIQRHGGVRL